MTSEGSERVERRKECKEPVDAEEFRQQMREMIEEVEEQVNREEIGMESGGANEERGMEVKRESTDIDTESEGDNEFRREMQDLIAEVRENSEKEESEGSDEFRKQIRELIDAVERDLEADGELVDSAEDRLDEFEEDILENFEKYGIDGDEVRERWRERFVEDVEEDLEKDSASDEPDESTNTSDDAADSEMNKTAESCSYSESGDGTVQVLTTEGSSEATESVDESEETRAEVEPQSESDSSMEGEKNRAVEESKQKEDMESPEAEKQAEKQIAHETESETSENSPPHELKRGSKETIPETSENARARQQTSEMVSESSEEKAEAAERKEAQTESIESHSARAEYEELVEEEVEDTQTEGHLNESADEEDEVALDSGSERMQEWTEDGEVEKLAGSERFEEPDSTKITSEFNQEVLEENISPDAEELDEDEEVDKRAASDDERPTRMLDSPYPTVYADETGFFAETEEERWRRNLVELYNDLPEEMKQLYRELVKAMLESEEGLEKLLDTFPELRDQEEFEEKHGDAIKYVKLRQKIRELDLLGTSDETTVEEFVLELAVDQETVEKWLNDDYYSFPKLIQQVWNQEIERRWGNVLRAIVNRDMPYDMSEVNEILKRFPELKRKRRFGWHYDEVKAWTEVMAAKRQDKIATLIIQGKERFKVDEVKELAARLNLTVDKVVRWLREESRPRLVGVLTGNRRNLRLNPSEESRSKAKSHNIIDTSKAHEAFQPLRDIASPSAKQLTDSLEELCHVFRSKRGVRFAQLGPRHSKGPKWFRLICDYVHQNRPEIQMELNKRLGNDSYPSRELRVGVVGNRIYLRWRNTDPNNWMNLYAKENFHLRSIEAKRHLVEEVRIRLGIRGNILLSRLIGQVTEYFRVVSDVNPNIDLKMNNKYLSGETVHFFMDVLEKHPEEMQDFFDYIGRGKLGWGVIRNPRLDTNPETVISRLVAIVGSDGHIDPNCHVTYSDGFTERIERVKEAFRQLGDVDLTETVHKRSGATYLHAPAVVGRLLVKVGMKPGDKTIQNKGLPGIVKNASPESKRKYLSELISDDGSFSVEDGLGEFQWYRSVALDAGNKAETYEHTPVVTAEQVAFIKECGTAKTLNFGSNMDSHNVHQLRWGHLRSLVKSDDERIASMARALIETIRGNPSRLLEEERGLCKAMGIKTRVYPTTLRYFEKSGRVTIAWQGQTASNEDAVRWAQLAPPNDARKKSKVEQWLNELNKGAGPYDGNTV